MNAVSVERLSKRFFRSQVLSDISFALPRGTITGLIGENGVGKSTLIRILLGLLEANLGRSVVLGMGSMKNGVAIRRRTGYVPDEFQLYDWMTPHELCTFIAPFYPTWDHKLAVSLLERMKLPVTTKVKKFSKGMKTRLLLVLALSHQPELLILDEPLSGLDPLVREDVLTHLSEYVSASGRTVLISSHQLSDIERICDRVVLLHQGKVRLDDYIQNIKEERGDLEAIFADGVPDELTLEDVSVLSRSSNRIKLYYRKNGEELIEQLRVAGADVENLPLDLEAIFKREAGGGI